MLLDYHLHHVLKRAQTLYVADAAKFAALFSGIDAAVVEAWRQQLVAKPPEVRLMGAQGVSDVHHLWVVSQQGAQPSEDALGNHLSQTIIGGMETQRADIYSAARDPEMAMCMHVVARAVVMAHRLQLMQGPYEFVNYDGFAGTTIEAEAIAEKLGLAVRIQNWSAAVVWQVPDINAPTPLTWSVRAGDVGGGVEPWEI